MPVDLRRTRADNRQLLAADTTRSAIEMFGPSYGSELRAPSNHPNGCLDAVAASLHELVQYRSGSRCRIYSAGQISIGSQTMTNFPRTGMLLVLLWVVMPRPEIAAEPGPLEVFEQRIMPIFKSPKPSSCVQCHLAAVDLKHYILPSHEQTFVSLRDQGLVDLERPAEPKILTLIRMGERDLDKGARLIHEKTRRAELDAFTSWIKACCEDDRLCGLPRLSANGQAGPRKPVEVIRHTRKSRVVDSFTRHVWSQRMRCFPCHTPHEIDDSNPRHQAAIKKHREFEQQYGSELTERLKIFRETPEATLAYLIQASKATPDGELPLINLEDPRQSLLVLKPLSKLPQKGPDDKFVAASSKVPVTHMGGLKMHPDDQSYKAFVTWIQDYANVVGDRYASIDQLPADNWHASQLVLRVRGAPDDWPVGVPVQLFVHAWDSQSESFEREPIAFTQGTVTPRRMVNGALFLLAHEGLARKQSPETAALTRGKYLVKTFVDFDRRLADDPSLLLGEKEFAGQAEITKARWRTRGRNKAEVIQGRALKRE